MAWFVEEQSKVTQQSILSSLTLANVARVEKESAVEAFLAEIKKYRDEILGKITRIGDYIKDNNDEQARCQQIIDDCDAKKTTFSEIPEYVALKIEHYADYRNYMTYEILLTNDVLTKAKLSKQSGYNSGAEVQIPYMLILLSALLMIYNDKSSSTRLVFIDEPFAKMDPTNVKIMLGFMKEQNLQMIFCAPDKTELIGNECEVVLPVLRTQPDLMEIGIIEMHKGV